MSQYHYKIRIEVVMVDGRGNTTTVSESEIGPFETQREAEDYLSQMDDEERA